MPWYGSAFLCFCVFKRSSMTKSRTETWATFLFCLGLGLFTFFVLEHPWQGRISSDDAVPFYMTLTPLSKFDLYYWDAGRFGTMFVLFWKILMHPIIGPHAMWFYLCHTLMYFLGVALLSLQIQHRVLRYIFMLMFIPLTLHGVAQMTYPGQLYPQLVFLYGIYFTVERRVNTTWGWSVALGATLALTYWVHELAGLVMIGLFASQWLVRSLRQEVQWNHRTLLPTAVMAGAGIWISELARGWTTLAPSGDDGHRQLYGPVDTFTNVIGLIKQGVPMYGGTHPGPFAEIIFLVLVIYCVRKILQHRRAGSLSRLEPVYTQYAVIFLFSIAAVIAISASVWVKLNHDVPRYFYFMAPLIQLYAFLVLEQIISSGTKWKRALCWAMTIALFVSAHRVNRRNPWTARPNYWTSLANAADQRVRAVGVIQTLGCTWYRDTYWASYLLTAVSNGAVQTSSVDLDRNPRLTSELFQSNRLCASPEVMPPKYSYAWLEFDPRQFQCAPQSGMVVCNRLLR